MIDFRDAALIIFGYFAGGIPTGYLVVKRLKGYDIRTRGSGNPGTANVYRNAGALAGAITLTVDALKGYAPVYLCLALQPRRPELAIAAGAAAIVGHNWTPLLGFKGGKGVATALGVLLGFSGILAGFAAGVWLAVAAITRYSSLAALVAAAAAPVLAWGLLGKIEITVVVAVMCAVLIYRHKSNIRKLLAGSEGRIGGRK